MDNAAKHARTVWQAGVNAVRSDALVQSHVTVDARRLAVGEQQWLLQDIDRLAVVGAGKAGAGMAAGLETALGDTLAEATSFRGWINVPADCVRESGRVKLHAARPAGRNEPTAEGVLGTEKMLQIVRELGPNDICICLISGGGSALTPAPREGVTLEDLLRITQRMSAAGATINQLNAVRKQLSAFQGGQLARTCRAGNLVSLIISDVIGDPLDIIASGPTVINDPLKSRREALQAFDKFNHPSGILGPTSLRKVLAETLDAREIAPVSHVSNNIIGNNATAVAAAVDKARELGYAVTVEPLHAGSSTAEEVGASLVNHLFTPPADRPWCVVSGGEPVVQLVSVDRRGRGGRNQQLVLSALTKVLNRPPRLAEWALLSGGTDGEDGPTDAAGAMIDRRFCERTQRMTLSAKDFLARNDAYTFFMETAGLIKTGATHTNVCDVRVVIGIPSASS